MAVARRSASTQLCPTLTSSASTTTDSCLTHQATGFPTIRADLATLPKEPFVGKVTGLWASPPCTDFSKAGKRAGVDGETGKLIYCAMDWVRALAPEWIVFEQVPDVLPYWERFAERSVGYWTWTGILNAADYGVPQTRERAFLLASRLRRSNRQRRPMPSTRTRPCSARSASPG